MSSERRLGHPAENPVLNNLLFQNGFSLDGRLPVTNYVLHEELPLLTGDTVSYDMRKRQHLSQKFDRTQYDVPFQSDSEVRSGCIRVSTIHDLDTGDVVDFSLGIKPRRDEKKTHDLLFVLGMLHEHGPLLDDPIVAYERIVPTCSIDSEEGISLHNGNGFILGYGPGFGEKGIEVSEGFANHLLNRQAMITNREDGSFYEARCTLLQAKMEMHDPLGNQLVRDFLVEGGLRLNKESYQQASDACIDMLQDSTNLQTAVYDIVEPFYTVTVTGDEFWD